MLQCHIELRNDGHTSIYYHGEPGVIQTFSITDGNADDSKERVVYENRNATWQVLAPGQSAVAIYPKFRDNYPVSISTRVSDWRGRTGYFSTIIPRER
ncbi:hypothetical protein MFFC18_21250 [Mariniblastus fucicola]|uniref:Uncharacterized protein n=1 Tax=Mariniblastus fucicola TaxID=980251 RepID=A0A5B9P9W0_9BACT|nr:hypothetical protein MFFC18_21250 [Mariniblastus fucicola]